MIGILSLGRIALAGVTLVIYATLCGSTYLRQRRKRLSAADAAAALAPAVSGAHRWIVAFASQTGNAEQHAWNTGKLLHTAGVPTRVVALGDLRTEHLREIDRALFIVSTYGEGDAPDTAALFARNFMSGQLPLEHLHYGVLALGDDNYRNFCGFGRTLDSWLGEQGARSLFSRIDVNNDDADALLRWRGELAHLVGTDDTPDWQAQAFEPWLLRRRRHLNPGSAGNPTFEIELVPAEGPLPHWESGDLVQVLPPGDSSRPREYSIASIPSEGAIRLMVRQSRAADGRLGVASGWLTDELALGSGLELRLRTHRSFRLGEHAARDLLLIGNGTGLAGLRAHIKAREETAARNWLIFGERNASYDTYYQDDLEAWLERGILNRLDLVFSRDQAERRYVQHRLLECADEVREWIDAGAGVCVCGSLEGMAGGVEAALGEILGRADVDRLIESGRYRRDVY